MKAIHNGDWRNAIRHLLLFLKITECFFSDEEICLREMVKDYTHNLKIIIYLSEHLKSPIWWNQMLL